MEHLDPWQGTIGLLDGRPIFVDHEVRPEAWTMPDVQAYMVRVRKAVDVQGGHHGATPSPVDLFVLAAARKDRVIFRVKCIHTVAMTPALPVSTALREDVLVRFSPRFQHSGVCRNGHETRETVSVHTVLGSVQTGGPSIACLHCGEPWVFKDGALAYLSSAADRTLTELSFQ